MNAEPLCDCSNRRVFCWRSVLRRPIPLRARRRSDRRISDWLYSIPDQVMEELRLLKVRVKFHFIHSRNNTRIAQEQPHLGDSHVRSADVTNQTSIDELF